MTKEKDVGGQAFPGQHTGYDYIPGMTLRDWFAGQAISGLAAKVRPGEAFMMGAYAVVERAYAIADEALRARLKDVEEE